MTNTPDPFELELSADIVVRAYQAGIFPMSENETDKEVFWVCPEQRGIIPLDGFKTSKSLRKALNNHNFTIKTDTDFLASLRGAPMQDLSGTAHGLAQQSCGSTGNCLTAKYVTRLKYGMGMSLSAVFMACPLAARFLAKACSIDAQTPQKSPSPTWSHASIMGNIPCSIPSLFLIT